MTMGVAAITVSPPARNGPSPLARRTSPHEFLRLMESLGRRLDARDPTIVRGVASQFVAELFYAPLLAEMRRFPLGRNFATGGQTESIFGERLDRRIADHVAAADHALVDQLTKRLQQQHAGRPARPTTNDPPAGAEVSES